MKIQSVLSQLHCPTKHNLNGAQNNKSANSDDLKSSAKLFSAIFDERASNFFLFTAEIRTQ
jgi:hypothetical protein